MATRKTTTTKKQTKGSKVKSARPIVVKARGRYKIVDGPSQTMIEPSSQEVRTED